MAKGGNVRRELPNGAVAVGSWMQIPNALMAEIIDHNRFDLVAVNSQHGSRAIENVRDVLRALALGGTVIVAPLAQNACENAKQALEAGACGNKRRSE